MRRVRSVLPFVIAIILALFAGWTAGGTLAVAPLPEVDDYVTDAAGLLREADRAQIAALLRRYDQETGNQMIVVTVPGLDGEDIEGYAIRLADKIKAGQKGKDNGAVLLIARDERRVRIEVGYGLEPVLPDGKCGDIIRRAIVPAFRRGDFAGGIRAGLAEMIAAVSPGFKLDWSDAPAPVQASPGKERSDWFLAFLVFLILFAVLGSLDGSRRRRWYRGGFGSGPGPIFWGGGWGSGSGGGFSGGGGGFSGGGGGFGGGGASGSW